MRDDAGGIVTVCLSPSDKRVPTLEAERVAFVDITDRVIKSLQLVLENRHDPWRAINIIANAEQLMDLYASHGFVSLLPLQRRTQATLYKAWRIARRQFIKRALLAPPHEREGYMETLREGWLDGPDANEDFEAVERHLDEEA